VPPFPDEYELEVHFIKAVMLGLDLGLGLESCALGLDTCAPSIEIHPSSSYTYTT